MSRGSLTRLATPALLVQLLACAPPSSTESGSESRPAPDSAAQIETTSQPPTFEAVEQASNTTSRLQAVSAVDTRVVWASGLDGTVVRTINGGETWQERSGAGGADSKTLQFRDIHAFDENAAYLLAAGKGDLSRIYRTADGGDTWELQFLNLEREGFLDCFDFWDRDRAIAFGDSVRGELFVLTTGDGSSWSRVPAEALPNAAEGEGGFAASGTCVDTGPEGRARIATGAGGSARVLSTEDYGATWTAAETPTVRGNAAGLMSVVFATDRLGVAVGGDLEQAQAFTANVSISEDGGRSWSAGGALPFQGAAYGAAWRAGLLVAAGPGGIATSIDSGHSFKILSDVDTWSVDFGDDKTFWAVGPEGRITRFSRGQ